jgi:hypothetical protein
MRVIFEFNNVFMYKKFTKRLLIKEIECVIDQINYNNKNKKNKKLTIVGNEIIKKRNKLTILCINYKDNRLQLILDNKLFPKSMLRQLSFSIYEKIKYT